MTEWPPISIRARVLPLRTASPPPPRAATMTTESQPKNREGALSSLNVAIDIVNLAKEVSDITPAKAAFGTVSILLTMIRVRLLFRDAMFQVHTWSGLDA